MRANNERRGVRIRLGTFAKDAENIAALLLFLVNHDVRGEFKAFAIEAAHEVTSVQLVLQFLQGLARRFEQRFRHGVRDTDASDSRRSERGIEAHRHQLLDHFAVRSADDDQAACAFLPSRERFVTETGIAHEFVPAFLRNTLWDKAEDEHPFVLHFKMRITAVGLDFLAIAAHDVLRCLDAVTRKDDVRMGHLAKLRNRERTPVFVQLERGIAR